jgi:hypothetical protein
LEKRIAAQPKRKNRHILFILSMAASLLLFISVGSYLWLHTPSDTQPGIAKTTVPTKDTTCTIKTKPSLADNTVAVEETINTHKQTHKRKAAPQLLEGQVLDNRGEAVPGAVVKIKGKDIAAITDINGKFKLKMTKTDSTVALLISSLGLEEKEIIAKNKDKGLQISLNEESEKMDELVVTGYAQVMRRDMVTAVSSVSASSLKDAPNYSFKKHNFKKFFNGKAEKGICGEEKSIVHVEFVINRYGRPEDIVVTDCSCDDAKDEVIRLLKNSPRWTYKEGKKVSMKLKW